MRPILAGIETEYGFLVEGRTPKEQVSDAMRFVAAYPGSAFVGWDYRQESPRSDLRGFRLDALAYDPEDAKFDAGNPTTHATAEERADRVTVFGARLYNDHGHPEFSTPECFSLADLVAHDWEGVRAMLACCSGFDLPAKLYRNNTDFHGASYGTHENYLVPRALGFDRLYRAIMPVLVARQILCGAGKVGSEKGSWCDFQISQRADFFAEPYNAETLYRRPIFNTRDEPHADPAEWIRLHVIAGDANMIPTSTRWKAALVKLAIALEEVEESPCWSLTSPVEAFQAISRDASHEFRVELSGGSHTTAYDLLESYLAAARATLDLDPEMRETLEEMDDALARLRKGWQEVRRQVDWAAKRWMLETHGEVEGAAWRDPYAQSLDLAYADLDPEEGLYYGLVEMEEVEPPPESPTSPPPTRAALRAVAAQDPAVRGLSWSCVRYEDGHETYLDPAFRPE